MIPKQNPYKSPKSESPAATPPESWAGITRRQYLLFFGMVGGIIYGTITLVSPGLRPVLPALQNWAHPIFIVSTVGVPTVAVVLSMTAFRPPVSHWPVVELLSATALFLAAINDLLDPPFQSRLPFVFGVVLILSTVIFAASIQSAVGAIRCRHLWKAIAGIPAVLTTGAFFLLETAIFLLQFD